MIHNFTGKSVLVTGASRGIGRSIAERFLINGAHVAFNARNSDLLERVVTSQSNDRAIPISGDVTNPDDAHNIVQRTLNLFKHIDVLVCNVGSGRSVPPGQETYLEWQRVFSLNLWSTTNMVEAAMESLVERRGVIICISSICGIETVLGAPVTYSASKSALNSYIRGISRPLGKAGVRINGIAPGNIIFDGSTWDKKLSEDSDEVNKMLHREVSLGKLGNPNDVSNLALWLASPASSFCTGSIFVADGGQLRS